jgi:hypothetical protein
MEESAAPSTPIDTTPSIPNPLLGIDFGTQKW